jgi:hypothetical protein
MRMFVGKKADTTVCRKWRLGSYAPQLSRGKGRRAVAPPARVHHSERIRSPFGIAGCIDSPVRSHPDDGPTRYRADGAGFIVSQSSHSILQLASYRGTRWYLRGQNGHGIVCPGSHQATSRARRAISPLLSLPCGKVTLSLQEVAQTSEGSAHATDFHLPTLHHQSGAMKPRGCCQSSPKKCNRVL